MGKNAIVMINSVFESPDNIFFRMSDPEKAGEMPPVLTSGDKVTDRHVINPKARIRKMVTGKKL